MRQGNSRKKEDSLIGGERLSFRQRCKGIICTLGVIWRDRVDGDYTDILLQLLDEQWHISEEDIVSILKETKDPKSVDKLHEVTIDIPDYMKYGL